MEKFKKTLDKNYRANKIEDKFKNFKQTKIQIEDIEGKKFFMGEYKKE